MSLGDRLLPVDIIFFLFGVEESGEPMGFRVDFHEGKKLVLKNYESNDRV